MLLSQEKCCCLSGACLCKQKYIFSVAESMATKQTRSSCREALLCCNPGVRWEARSSPAFLIFNALVWNTKIFIQYAAKGLLWEISWLHQSITPCGELSAMGLPPTRTRLSKLIKTDQILMCCLRCVGLELLRISIIHDCGRTLVVLWPGAQQMLNRYEENDPRVISGVKPLFARKHRERLKLKFNQNQIREKCLQSLR